MSVSHSSAEPTTYGVTSETFEDYFPGIVAADAERLAALSAIVHEAEYRFIPIDMVERLDVAALYPTRLRREMQDQTPPMEDSVINHFAKTHAATQLGAWGATDPIMAKIEHTQEFQIIASNLYAQQKTHKLHIAARGLARAVYQTGMTRRFSDNPTLNTPGIVTPEPVLYEALMSRHPHTDERFRSRRTAYYHRPNQTVERALMVNSMLVGAARYATYINAGKPQDTASRPDVVH